jgi:hypothetical protein
MTTSRPRCYLGQRRGGLTSLARYGSQAIAKPAWQGTQTKFERLVDPEGILEPAERQQRAQAARRAHMLLLAEKSAEARRRRK